MKKIDGLRQIHEYYDTFFIDLWGVIHNGIKPYDGAIEVLKNLNKLNKRFVLISNAPRPSKDVEKFLLNLKIDKVFLKNIFTSGEAALQSLKKEIYGKNFYHLGPARDQNLFKGLENNKKDLEKADFILCTGFLENHTNSLDYYKKLLSKYINLVLICTNPDLIVYRGAKQEYCAGTIAEIFKELGGKVIYFGKPYKDIYKFCIRKNEKVLAIGDNIRTDIRGANNMNFDSLLITEGIHKNEFINSKLESYDKILEKYKAKTNYHQEKLNW